MPIQTMPIQGVHVQTMPIQGVHVRARSIVVGVLDGRCAGPLAYALRAALVDAATIRVVRVSPGAFVASDGPQLPVDTVELVGDPADLLLRESRDADVLVVEAPRDALVALTDSVLVRLRRLSAALVVEVDHDGEIVRASGAEHPHGPPGAEPLRAPVRRTSLDSGVICVGVDSSPASDVAVTWAAGLAAGTASTLQLVSSYGPGDGQDDHASHRTMEDAQDDVAAAAALVAATPSVSIVARGETAQVLLDASRGARMLVVGRHSRRGMIHGALGGVGDTCARLADCPVVIVPPR